jgi:hypothetical protein
MKYLQPDKDNIKLVLKLSKVFYGNIFSIFKEQVFCITYKKIYKGLNK